MAEIPCAKSFVQTQEEKQKSIAKAVEESNIRWLARLKKASSEFVDGMTKICCKSIADAAASTDVSSTVRVVFKTLGMIQGLPGDVLLYGHRHTDWQKRESLDLSITPFEHLQANFYEKGWFLVEETDPNRSNLFVFGLYPWKPATKKILWHGHNVFDEDKIKSILEKKSQEDIPEPTTLPFSEY